MKTKDLQIVSLFLLLGLLCLLGCQSNQVTKHTPTKQKTGFISNKQATEDATYQGIQSNVARLHAMLTGSFIQYSNLTPKETPNEYSVWKVNDGKDSVMLYSIPIGDPNKIGYWIYHYQILTSLPEEPIYEGIEQLIEIDRDTINGYFYGIPEDFDVSISDLINKNRNAFSSIDVHTLQKSEADEDKPVYIRQNPLLFKDESLILKNTYDNNFLKNSYAVYPSGIVFKTIFYNDSVGTKVVNIQQSEFVKTAMVK